LASAQLLDQDSLEQILPYLEGEERLIVLNELATILREKSQQQAFEYSEEAENLAQDLGNKSAEAKAKENIGWIYYRRGQWQKTFDYSKEAYELAIEAEDSKEAARILNSMGALYYEQNNYPKAIQHFKDAYEISKKVDDLYTMIRSLNNIAFNFSQMGELDSAIFYSKRSIQTNTDAGSPYLTSFANRVIGDVFLARNQLDSAEITFEKALQMANQRDITSFKATLLHRLGNTYLQLGKLDEAKKVLDEGVRISQDNNYLDELSRCHRYLAKVYEEMGDTEQAYLNQSIFVALNDSLVNKTNADRIALLQGMFQEDLEQSELDLLIAQNENQATRLNFARKMNLIVGLGALLISGLVVWLYFLIRNVKNYNEDLIIQKQKIHDQNVNLEAQSKQLREINQTKNKLFSILGHDLRGPVGQVKTIVDLLLSGDLSKSEFEELIQNLKKDVDSVYFTLNNTLKWSMAQMEGFRLHQKSFDLMELVNSNLALIEPQLKEKNLTVESSLGEVEDVYADRDLIDVVIRNILNNAVKFSNPGEVIQITSQTTDDQVKMCIIDNGIGMEEEQIHKILAEDYVITNSLPGTKKEKGSGLGLQICKEFTRMNGGELTIESEKNQGTKVCIGLPVQELIHN